MKKTLLSIFIILVFAVPTSVQADALNGKGILCTEGSSGVGYVFNKGYVTKWIISGYKKQAEYTTDYELNGTRYIRWYRGRYHSLDRQRLLLNGVQCEAANKEEIFKSFDKAIEYGKKKNKI